MYSVFEGPLIWPNITPEAKATSVRKYKELDPPDVIQANCDVKATNIILQGLPPEIYSLFSHHRIAKELWARILTLMQGTSLSQQECECKLYDAFDRFTYIPGESLHDYHWRFTMLINEMNTFKMKVDLFQVKTKFLNTLPPTWSKFVTDVKIVNDLHVTNVDQLYAYLQQHEQHVALNRIHHEHSKDTLVLVATHQPYNYQHSFQSQPYHQPHHSPCLQPLPQQYNQYGYS